MRLYTLKEIADEFRLHPRTVKRWWKRLRVPPRVAGNGCHRWTRTQVNTLLRRWAEHWKARGRAPRRAT